ncbi:MAG: YfiR family protein [Pirellulales bacterium]|nr:YfiR family protein [Pirellulales bacterium]
MTPNRHGGRRATTRSAGLPRGGFWLVVVGLGVLVCWSSVASAQVEINPRHEYNVKAAYLYSFGRYVQWPRGAFAGPDSPFVLGVLGEDPFAGALDRIAQTKRIQNRPIVVRRWKSLSEYESCHILFISRTVSLEEQMEVIRRLGDRPVLLAGDAPDFASRGGTLSFFVDVETVRFEINVNTVRRQRLTINAKLLKLAAIVEDPNAKTTSQNRNLSQ